MFDLDKWQEILGSLRKHKLRTGLTMFGVYWGIFMLVILLGAGNGLQNGAEYEFRDDATNSIWIYRGRTSVAHKGLQKGRQIEFDNSDYKLLKNEIPGVEYLTGRFYIQSGETIAYGEKNFTFNTRSVHPDHIVLENTIMKTGRYINQKDIEDYRKVCVIGKLVQAEIFPYEEPLGKYIRINNVDFQVVGTFTDTGGDGEMRIIYLPITTSQRVFSTKDEVHQIMVTTGDADVEEALAIQDNINKRLASKHHFSVDDPQALRFRNRVEQFERIMGLFTVIRLFTWIVGIGSIIAGVIGVANIMLIVVKDRTKEIGIRKALGATPGSIVSMILQEAVAITSFAGYLGMASGIAIINALSDLEAGFFRHPNVNSAVVISAVIVLVLAGALAGLIPALQAARVNPVVAMRED